MPRSPETNRFKLPQGAGRIPLSVCVLDLARERVLRGDAIVSLTTRESRLLAYLSERPGEDVSRADLLVHVWGYSPRARSRAVEATVQRLRGKIERDPAAPDHLKTVWGSGYRFVAGSPVPTTADRFVGRDSDIDQVSDALARTSRLVTITGPSGAGKTRLAREVMARLECDARFCALEEATDTASLVRGIATALDLDPGPSAEMVPVHLVMEDLLLVLDNVEQAIGPAAQLVVRMLASSPRLRILATSREALAVSSEHTIELGPLPIDDAITLLRERGARHEWAHSSEALGAIAERLERMPLALELAAGLASVLSPDELLARLDSPLDVLVSRRRDVPGRHQSLRHAVAWSFAQLDPGDAEALLRLSVFSGGFTVDAAEGVLCANPVAVIGRLRARSLLRPLPERDGRLALYDAVRAYALDTLGATSGLRDAQERHRTWYVDQAQRRINPAGPTPLPADVAFVTAEIGNVGAAFRHSLPFHPIDAARLALAAMYVFVRRGPVEEAVAMFDACLRHDLPASLRGHVLRSRGTAALLLGRSDEALADAREAIEVAQRERDLQLEGRALGLLGMVEHKRGDLASALTTFERAIALTRQARDPAFEATVAGNYGSALCAAEREGDGIRQYERSIALHRARGNSRSAAIMLSNVGLYDVDGGQFERGRSRLAAALAEHRRLGHHLHEGVTLGHVAHLEVCAGHLVRAQEILERGIALLASIGEQDNRAHQLLLLATVAWARGDRRRARDELERARALIGDRDISRAPVALLDLLLRIDEGEAVDVSQALADLPEPPRALERELAIWHLTEGFLAAAQAKRTRDVALCERARVALGQVSERGLAITVEPWRSELARRVAALR